MVGDADRQNQKRDFLCNRDSRRLVRISTIDKPVFSMCQPISSGPIQTTKILKTFTISKLNYTVTHYKCAFPDAYVCIYMYWLLLIIAFKFVPIAVLSHCLGTALVNGVVRYELDPPSI